MKTLFAAIGLATLLAAAPAAQAQEGQHPGENAAPKDPGGPAGHAPGGPAPNARRAEGLRPAEAPAPAGPLLEGPRGGPAGLGMHGGGRMLGGEAPPAGLPQAPHGAMLGPPVRPGAPPQGPSAGLGEVRAGGSNGRPGPGAPRAPAVAALRRNVRAQRRFHAGGYPAPRGYAPRHWRYGERLPRAYFARDYWITNAVAYALFAPPEGLVWVRVGEDALLIDEYTGEIIQVDDRVFY